MKEIEISYVSVFRTAVWWSLHQNVWLQRSWRVPAEAAAEANPANCCLLMAVLQTGNVSPVMWGDNLFRRNFKNEVCNGVRVRWSAVLCSGLIPVTAESVVYNFLLPSSWSIWLLTGSLLLFWKGFFPCQVAALAFVGSFYCRISCCRLASVVSSYLL